MLIEVLIDDLMKFARAASDAEDASDAQTNFRFCQRTASDAETIKCIDGFDDDVKKTASWWSNALADLTMSERLHLDDLMHWRVGGFARRLHLTMRRSDALAGFRFCQEGCTLMIECIGGLFVFLPKSCTWRWNDQMHWRIFDLFRCLGYRCSGEVFDCLVTQAGRRQTDETGRRQAGKRQNVKNEAVLADC